jgi:hypothetical protein
MNFWIVPIAVATLASGCVGSPPAKDGTLICIYPQTEGASFCQTATNLTAKEVTNQTSLCTSSQGTVVTACPVDSVGCCATTSGTTDFDKCFYNTSAAPREMACATSDGIWTAGSEAGSETGDAGDAGSETSDAGDAGATE